MSPISEPRIDRLLARLEAGAGARVLDVGCGNGEMLRRLASVAPIRGLGIDRNAAMIKVAAERTVGLPADRRAQLEWRTADASTILEGGEEFDVVLCMGATGAFGGYDGTLRALRRLLRVGGRALVGEGYWRQAPDHEYLDVLHASPTEMSDFASTARRAQENHFDVLEAVESTSEEWDAYEGLYADAIERWCDAHSADPDSAAFLARIATWREAYRRWGRETLGFGSFVLVRRPYD